jgi:hypothetical protein
MKSRLAQWAAIAVAVGAGPPAFAGTQAAARSWLDVPKPAPWNRAGAPIPAAPTVEGRIDARCRAAARPAQLEEDTRLRERGWDLVGPYQGGWQTVVIRATAGYDGMCRPRRFQDFVFVRGAFAGTLSPQPMESRTDGAVGRVYLQSGTQLTAEYNRYAANDPFCCPSRTTSVVFEIAGTSPVLAPVSTSTSRTARP